MCITEYLIKVIYNMLKYFNNLKKYKTCICCGADKHVDPANVLSLMRTSNDSQRQ